MNTTAAATQAGVTIPTIRNWCRRGVIAAVKQAGRWIIDTASLARRIAIGQRKARMTNPEQPARRSMDNVNRRAVTTKAIRLFSRESGVGDFFPAGTEVIVTRIGENKARAHVADRPEFTTLFNRTSIQLTD